MHAPNLQQLPAQQRAVAKAFSFGAMYGRGLNHLAVDEEEYAEWQLRQAVRKAHLERTRWKRFLRAVVVRAADFIDREPDIYTSWWKKFYASQDSIIFKFAAPSHEADGSWSFAQAERAVARYMKGR